MSPRTALVALMLTAAGPAHAVCTTPAGAAGEFRFNSTNARYEVCDDAVWTSMSAAAPSGSCSTAGALDINTSPRFCNGSLFVSMAGPDTGAACSGPALMTYNSTLKYMQYCNGTNQKSMRSNSPGITFVQHAERNLDAGGGTANGSSTSGSFTGSGNVTTGNTVVCFVAFSSESANVTSMTLTGGQALTRAIGPILLGNSAGYSGEIWYRTNITGSTGSTVAVNLSATQNVITTLCDEYSGVAQVNGLDKTASKNAQASSATVTAGPVTTTTAKELLYAGGCWTTVASGGTVAGSGYTRRSGQPNDCITEDRLVAAAGSYSAILAGGQNNTGSTGFVLMATLRGQ